MRRRSTATRIIATAVALGLAASLGACAAAEPNGARAVNGIVPAPASIEPSGGAEFRLDADTVLRHSGDGAEAVAEGFAERLRASTGFALPVEPAADAADPDSGILLVVAAGEAPGGAAEGYTLEAGEPGVRIGADTAAGLFYGVQSLRQLLPGEIERSTPGEPEGGWTVPAVRVSDAPRFAYRGAMLDVSRHFFGVDDVVRYLDAVAMLKFNHLHLHLSDDQGWRIEISSWPKLAEIGGQGAVGGASGGFYTKADYARIVEEAAKRHITVVPEIDLPGHTNAALVAYPELACDDVAPEPYGGIEVGFSTLCPDDAHRETVDRFLAEVLGELAEMTPGPYLHVGGDESLVTTPEQYRDLVDRITAAGAATGKTLIGWHEMGVSDALPAGMIGQYWDYVEPRDDAAELARSFVRQGGSVILSPADAAYLDMKYPDDPVGPLGGKHGLIWADGPTTLEEAYAWEPSAIVPELSESDILGVEAPIWTETLSTMTQVEWMVFPRIASIAELAWSPKPDGARDGEDFAARVAGFGEHLDWARITYRKVGGVPWTER